MTKEGSDSKNLDAFTTRMDPKLKEKVRAVAWYNRKAQREIVERALEDYFKKHVENLDEALNAFRKAGG